jgi:hypothetical protein
MSRRLVVILAALAVSVFGIVYFWPDAAGAGGVSARLHLGDSGIRMNGGIDGKRWSDGRDHDHWHTQRRHRDRWDNHRHRGGFGFRLNWPRSATVLSPYSTGRVIERETIIVPQAPPPAPVTAAPPPVTAAPTASPLDPQGTARTVSARGEYRPREWVLGAPLPPDLPHVTLDPSAYGLPAPPDGQLYARVEGDVLRIEAGSRRILGVLAD